MILRAYVWCCYRYDQLGTCDVTAVGVVTMQFVIELSTRGGTGAVIARYSQSNAISWYDGVGVVPSDHIFIIHRGDGIFSTG